MQCTSNANRAAAPICSSSKPHIAVKHATTVVSTQQVPYKVTFGSTLWPSQHHVHHLAGGRCRVVACQAGPSAPLAVPAATYDFSPHVDSTVLGGQVLVLAITLGAAAYWWWSVVPSARRALAKEKRSGPLKEYLVELQQNPDKGVERWFYTDWLQQLQRRQQLEVQAAAKRAASTTESSATTANVVNTATTSDGAGPTVRQPPSTSSGLAADTAPVAAEQQQPPPLAEPYVDTEPSFWSLDNPLLASAVLLAAVAVLSTLLHGTSQTYM